MLRIIHFYLHETLLKLMILILEITSIFLQLQTM